MVEKNLRQVIAAVAPSLEELVRKKVAEELEKIQIEDKPAAKSAGRPKIIKVKSPKDGRQYKLSSDPAVAFYQKNILGIK